VSYRVASAAKSNFIAEILIGPCVKDVVQCLFGENAAEMVENRLTGITVTFSVKCINKFNAKPII
jgi:hypothetical protein